MQDKNLNSISEAIIGAAIEVHRNLGPGLLEHAYKLALWHELSLRGINAGMEVEVPLTYKGVNLGSAYRADLLVEDEIIVELKATENDNPLFARQLNTYLRLANKRLGLLINFNRALLTHGIKRIVNNL